MLTMTRVAGTVLIDTGERGGIAHVTRPISMETTAGQMTRELSGSLGVQEII